MNNDYFECECAVCHKNYLTDGGDVVCGDVACEAIFEQSTVEVTVQFETAVCQVSAQFEEYANSLGV